MKSIPDSWYRFLMILAIVAVAVAAFEFGVLWQQHHKARLPADSASATADDINSPLKSSSTAGISIRAEFNPQSALLIGASELVRFHQQVFKDLVKAVQGRIPIIGFVNDENEFEIGREILDKAGLPVNAVHFIKHPLNSMWIRDYGPIFSRLANGTVGIVHATYSNPDVNDPRTKDDAFATYIGKLLHLKVDRMPLVLEGGNLMSNGEGLMVTSTRVIERPENQRYTVQQIGKLLGTHLGCQTLTYLRPLENEPTGHIDLCLTFLRRNLVVVGKYDKTYDPVNAAILDDMAAMLKDMETSMGPMMVERIPMPPRTKEGEWRSYCNVLIINGIILVPSYTGIDPALEKEAVNTYKRLMPTWKVETIVSDSLIKKQGFLHCIGITVPGHVDILPLIGEAL